MIQSSSHLWDESGRRCFMVDVKKLKARMALIGYTQRSLVEEMSRRGYKMSENTLSAKMRKPSKFNCDDADVICDILLVEHPAEKADIFLA
jgi:hypothetical protein